MHLPPTQIATAVPPNSCRAGCCFHSAESPFMSRIFFRGVGVLDSVHLSG